MAKLRVGEYRIQRGELPMMALLESWGKISMKTSLSRRAFLGSAVALSASSAFGFSFLKNSAPKVKIHDLRVISKRPEIYHGWPTLARRANGELLVVCSGGREAHVCPFGRVDLMRSHDNGETWTWPRTLLDGAIDDRDAGILETAQGSLLVTTFTSLAYVPTLKNAMAKKPGEPVLGPKKNWHAGSRPITA